MASGPAHIQPTLRLSAGLRRLGNQLQSYKAGPQHKFEAGLSGLATGLSKTRMGLARQEALDLEEGLLRLTADIDQAKKEGKWIKTHFNTFDVLGFPHNRLERIHSNILAWLLDPFESHRFGFRFLKRIVKSRFDLRIRENEMVSVHVERQDGEDRPDIVVEGEGWRLIIENKVDASEGEDQTFRYATRYTRRKDKKPHLLFVSRSNAKGPDNEAFKRLTYNEIADIITELNRNSEGSTATFLLDFISHIRRNIEWQNQESSSPSIDASN